MKRNTRNHRRGANMRLKFIAAVGGFAVAVTFLDPRSACADTVVQFSVDALLNARPVSTLTNGAVVTWSPTQGVDGNGNQDGYATKAVVAKLAQMGNALPDDGVFPAANGNPEIVLHFSNDNPPASFQARNVHHTMADSIGFAVPQATYSKIFLVLTSAEGADKLTVTLTYADATTSMIGPFTLTDYDTPIPANTADVSYFSLISMRKWSQANQQGDNAGHQITGVSLTPMPTKPLTRVVIAKPADGQYLVFWGATGIATSPVDVGGPIGGLDAGTADAGADSVIGATNDGGSGGMTGGPSGSGGASGGGSSGTGGTVTGSGASTGGASGSGTGPAPSGGASSSGGCSLSASSVTAVGLWKIMLALFAVGVGVRRSRARSGR